MVIKDSFTRGMEATREKIVRLGGGWGRLLGGAGEGTWEEAEEVPDVADIVRGGGGDGGGGGEERNGIFRERGWTRWDFIRLNSRVPLIHM